MYEELVKRLRDISNSDSNIKSNYIGLTMIQAANAIDELLTLKVLADAKIERLESANTKKKRPPKRLPCTCGQKRLELWWSSDPSERGWFLKCPNCGRESQRERYKSHVNSVWNDGLPELPKEET